MVSSLCDIKSLYRKLLLVCKYFATTPWSYVAQNGTSKVAVIETMSSHNTLLDVRIIRKFH